MDVCAGGQMEMLRGFHLIDGLYRNDFYICHAITSFLSIFPFLLRLNGVECKINIGGQHG